MSLYVYVCIFLKQFGFERIVLLSTGKRKSEGSIAT